jgi:hypothetical protein
MRTDELRRELHDLADELEPFTGDAGRVRTRVRRRRLATAGAFALLLVIGVGLTVAATSGTDDDGVTTVDGKSVDVADLHERDALVIGRPDDADRIRTLLEASDLVERFVVLRPGAASAVANQFGPSDGVGLCEPDSGFLVDLDDADDVAGLEALLPAGTTAFSWQDWIDPPKWRDMDAEIFMNVDASDAEVEAMRAELADDEDVASVEYLSKDDAYEVFKQTFADRPDLIASTSPDALPVSFRVKLAGESDLSRYDGARGVNEVIRKPSRSSIEATLDDVEAILMETPAGQGVEAEIFMNVDATDAQINAVRTMLDDDPSVATYEFLSKQDAYEEFKRIFADQEQLVESTNADALPTSFRVTPTADATFNENHVYNGLVGVNEVLTAESLCNR